MSACGTTKQPNINCIYHVTITTSIIIIINKENKLHEKLDSINYFKQNINIC